MSKYSLGLDFGTLSVRALLVDVKDGREIATAESVYKHGVFGEKEVSGEKSKSTTALQDPQDYIDGLKDVIKEVLLVSGVNKDDIVGLGVDFTSSTILPTFKGGTPLCQVERFKNNPHAYVKLWKHHGAEKEAEIITKVAKENGETWLDGYGGKVSSEWMFPKILEILNKAPEVYGATDSFVEAGDWIVTTLTGQPVRSCCMAGFKAFWDKNRGYPDWEFFSKVHPDLRFITVNKVSKYVFPVGEKAGALNAYGAKLCGLNQGLPVAVSIIDAHAAVPAAGVTEEGNMLMILGTSAVHLLLSKQDKEIKGICGKVADGVIPGLVAYEAGQTGFGDCFDWVVKNCVPESYTADARNQGKTIFEYLNEKAEKLSVGQSGLIALDWWNGNRTPYADYDLGGAILGLNLHTKPEEIYRAVIEAVAFGTKRIVDVYQAGGLKVDKITAAGGIAGKNPFLMQLLSDILGLDISVVESKQAGAKGSAIYAAVAGGVYKNVSDAAAAMSDKSSYTYRPNLENTKKYALIYKEYITLSEYFAKENDVMKKLRNIK